ncbi:HAMP domain-containing sensor histidine kinase [Glycomyces sp. NPDC047010]|uniref:sensor histidine kinase n=1 Tax=Glycomyces sp. NPDC047010 TaxID=3155023 RepID=UPI0033F60935
MAVAIVALCGLALSAAVITATALLGDVLTDRIDDRLRTAAEDAGNFRPPEGLPDGVGSPGPRAPVSERPRVYVYDEDGALVGTFGQPDGEADFPALTGLGDLAGHASSAAPYTVDDVNGNAWRILVLDTADGFEALALSAETVEAATGSLVVIGGVVVLAVLVLLALCASWVVRVGLRPLDRMQSTAAAIAEGRLGERVADTDPHTETGRLGAALNTMLTRIQAALDDSAASDAKLRQFLADASHELRSPLTSIRGFAQLYRRGGTPPGPVLDEAMGRIEAESRRMGRLLDDLMLLAVLDRDRPLRQGPVDLLGLCAEVVGDAHVREPGRFIAIEPLHEGDGLLDTVEVVGDEPRLRQVVTNLVVNALAHTAPDAKIALRLGRSRRCEWSCLAQIGEPPPPPAAVVEVADTGPGVPPEYAEAVFERLYRIDPGRARVEGGERGGSGLGLSIVAAIVAGHGGCVQVSSTPGGGATFRVLLPGDRHP